MRNGPWTSLTTSALPHETIRSKMMIGIENLVEIDDCERCNEGEGNSIDIQDELH